MSLLLDQLQNRGVRFERLPHAKTFSSLEEAEALGVRPDDVLKTVVLDFSNGHAKQQVPGFLPRQPIPDQGWRTFGTIEVHQHEVSAPARRVIEALKALPDVAAAAAPVNRAHDKRPSAVVQNASQDRLTQAVFHYQVDHRGAGH